MEWGKQGVGQRWAGSEGGGVRRRRWAKKAAPMKERLDFL
jgi:hypothetical protein